MESPRYRWRPRWLSFGCLLLTATGHAAAQEPPLSTLNLRAAVELAQSHHPALRARAALVDAAGEGHTVARSAYLPSVDLLWQQNRATRANVFGMLLPQSVVPSISGPVQDTPTPSSVWGSAAGALLTWEIVDFGRRSAAVEVASAELASAIGESDLTELEIGTSAAEAFLAVLAADQLVSAARANIDRVEVFQRSVSVLVENQLRPGVDAARADAELAGARIQIIEAERAAQLARIALADALGVDGPIGPVDRGRLLGSPSPGPSQDASIERHPAARVRQAAIETSQARAALAGKIYLPRIDLQSAVFARGSGAVLPDFDPRGSGLWPNVSNWAAGVSVTFPVLEAVPAHARQRLELANARAAEAEYEQTVRHLRAEDAGARALVAAAEQIAANTPIQLDAAQAAARQATGRYDAGLGTVTEVADAQRVLAQAEVDDALARLAIWRARLAVARSAGDLAGFLNQIAP